MNIFRFLCIIFFTYTSTFISKPHTEQHHYLFPAIAQENEKTLFDIDKVDDLQSVISGDKHFFEVLESTLQNHINPLADEKRRLVFDIYINYEKDNPFLPTKVLDTTSWQDLEILCGPKEHLNSYSAKNIDHTFTEMGKVSFYKTIVTPISDISELRKRQSIVKKLAENDDLFEALCKEFKELQETEGCLLSFWKEDIFENLLKQNAFKIPGSRQLTSLANKNPWCVEILNTGYLVGMLGSNAMLTAGAIILPITGIARLIDHPSTQAFDAFNKQYGFDKGLAFFSLTALTLSFLTSKTENNKYAQSASDILGAPMSGMNVLYVPDQLKGIITVKHCIQTKLMYLLRYINALKNIGRIAEKNTALSIHFPELKNINERLHQLEDKYKDIAKLFILLNSNTFKGKPSFFSLYGKMYVAYQLFAQYKKEFLPLIITGAELDVYLSSAHLIRNFEHKDISFCFPEYLENQNHPIVIVDDFWNPAISPLKAVPNSLYIGSKNRAHNVMVTGPNAGGKSTTMKGLVINLILAQSLGIAPAKSLSFTPFSTILTYMNIPDDIISGKSHFRAEACRAYNLLEAAQKSTAHAFTFIILDEVFNGTTFHEAQAATYALLHGITNNPYTTCIAVTHLPKIPALAEKSGRFDVYKVTSSITPEGLIHYSHTLKEGISQEPSIAFKILKQEGFNDTFLTEAYNFLNTHKETV